MSNGSRSELVAGDVPVGIEVPGRASGDQSPTAVECEVFICPSNEDQQPVLKLNDVQQMDKDPYQPGRQPPKPQTGNMGDGRGSADYCEAAFIEVFKRLP